MWEGKLTTEIEGMMVLAWGPCSKLLTAFVALSLLVEGPNFNGGFMSFLEVEHSASAETVGFALYYWNFTLKNMRPAWSSGLAFANLSKINSASYLHCTSAIKKTWNKNTGDLKQKGALYSILKEWRIALPGD